jgi:hypothetical protein
MWSGGQRSWLQIQRSGFDFLRYQIFCEIVVGLERGPLSHMSTIEELLERKSSGSGLENRDYGHRGSAALTTRHPSIREKLALTSPTSGWCSVSIVCSWTQATQFFFFFVGASGHAFFEVVIQHLPAGSEGNCGKPG